MLFAPISVPGYVISAHYGRFNRDRTKLTVHNVDLPHYRWFNGWSTYISKEMPVSVNTPFHSIDATEQIAHLMRALDGDGYEMFPLIQAHGPWVFLAHRKHAQT